MKTTHFHRMRYGILPGIIAWGFVASCAMVDTGRLGPAPDRFDLPKMIAAEKADEKSPAPPSTDAIRATEGPVRVTTEEAILMSLENNRLLKIERLNPAIRNTVEDEERAAFDSVLTGGISLSQDRGLQSGKTSVAKSDTTTSEAGAQLGMSRFFPAGTEVSGDLTVNRTDSDRSIDQYESRMGMSVTQALLRGAGTDANLANLRQARLGTRISQYELRGFAERLLAQVEETYWDYALAKRRIEIFEESMKLAEQQLRETEEMISVGKLAEIELAASQAEIALRRQDLINANSRLAATRLQLLRLLNPPGSDPWRREIHLLNQPAVPDVKLDDVQTHVALALRMRPDLNQARLGLERQDLEIVKTKNGLLPRMDFFITLGKTGYADTFGGSASDVTGDRFDALAGISLEYPFGNRKAVARHQRSLLDREQTVEAVGNLTQLVELDVRTAYIEVNRALEQIAATLSTRKLQEEKLRAETEKFRVGRSTNFLVAQAQRDLVSSRISEIEAVVSYLKSLSELHRLEGSLLERRGISAPGRKPLESSGTIP